MPSKRFHNGKSVGRWCLCAVLASSLAGVPGPAAAAAPPKPNFIMIIADDLARNEIGCYGGRNVRTPNIDRLATQGLRFNQAINSMSMCVPMRASTYTGLYPLHHGVTRNHAATKPGLKSIAHYLKDLGYRVGLTGKTHFRPPSVYPFEKVPGFEANCVARTAAYTLDGIRAFMTRDAREPFCLFVCSTLPHGPWTVGDAAKFPPDRLVLPPTWADTAETRQAFARYCAEIDVLDRQVGDVLDLVDDLGLDQSTLVVFNGEQGAQFPGGKWTNYDHGLAGAFIARWPHRVKAGATTEAIIQYEDIVPTLIELAGGTVPVGLDGRSFVGVLTGARAEHRDYAFALHNNVPEGRPYPIRTIRNTRYKLILNLLPDRNYHEKHLMDIDREGYWRSWVEAARTDPKAARAVQRYVRRPAVELYDLRQDPWELENLAEKPELAQIRAQLEKHLRDWMDQQGDPGAALDAEAPL
jgi:N-sulfoglucosamine sulfohydrolase